MREYVHTICSGTAAPACFPDVRSGDSDRSRPRNYFRCPSTYMPTLKSVYCIYKLLVGLTARFFGGSKRSHARAILRCIGGSRSFTRSSSIWRAMKRSKRGLDLHQTKVNATSTPVKGICPINPVLFSFLVRLFLICPRRALLRQRGGVDDSSPVLRSKALRNFSTAVSACHTTTGKHSFASERVLWPVHLTYSSIRSSTRSVISIHSSVLARQYQSVTQPS